MPSTVSQEREEFARRQAAMTSTWYENVKKVHGDVDRYIAWRHQAYFDRWREAGRFIESGDKVLDVGGGNIFPDLVAYFKFKNIDYHYVDIDPSAVEGTRQFLSEQGFNPGNANQGFNDNFAYPDETFQCVFASHCIEHSIDLPKTFLELNRILVGGGNLLMAVPFGWEENPEHPYFFDPDQWIALVQDAGFEIRVAQVGREYPETGHDFFIAARKIGPARSDPRIDAGAFKKDNYNFVDFRHPGISFAGHNILTDQGTAQHLRGADWKVQIKLEHGAREVLPVMLCHDWSGTALVSNELGCSVPVDLFSWFTFVTAARLTSDDNIFSSVEIHCTGSSAASWSSEGIFYGYMWR